MLEIALFSLVVAGTPALDPEDSRILLQDFLHLDDAGVDELTAYKRKTAVYVKYRDRKEPTAADVKLFLFFAYVTRHNNIADAAQSEALLSDMVPYFERHRSIVLEALADSPFLVAPVCYYLNGHFGFEDVPRDGVRAFLAKHEKRLRAALLAASAQVCLYQFGEHVR